MRQVTPHAVSLCEKERERVRDRGRERERERERETEREPEREKERKRKREKERKRGEIPVYVGNKQTDRPGMRSKGKTKAKLELNQGQPTLPR